MRSREGSDLSSPAISPTVETPAPPLCAQCGYNLTGILSGRCPECGWTIDWTLAQAGNEQRRAETSVFQARGWRKLPATLKTVLLMLLALHRFARRIRSDESLIPPLCVAIAAYLGTFVPITILDSWEHPSEAIAYLCGIALCIGINCLGFVLLCLPTVERLSAMRRGRLILAVSLYSTCFVAAWLPFGPPGLWEWNDANFLWPLERSASGWFPTGIADSWTSLFRDGQFLGRTVVFYWWLLILWTFAIIRGRRRWTVYVFLPIPLIAGHMAARLVTWLIH